MGDSVNNVTIQKQEYKLKTVKHFVMAAIGIAFLGACSPPASSLKKTIEENPDILFNAIEKHPEKFFAVVEKAGQEARAKASEGRFEEELKRVEAELQNPADIKVDDARAHGPKSAPITIVEYSDYNCGHCGTAHKTMEALKAKYGDKVRFVFKNLPILAPSSKLAAQYKEAIALQDSEKAYNFHAKIFEKQGDLRQGGEDFLKKLAKEVGADMSKLQKDLNSKAVEERIAADVEEAQKYEFNGTPGFMVNGASIHGAYPPDFFIKVIDMALAKKS